MCMHMCIWVYVSLWMLCLCVMCTHICVWVCVPICLFGLYVCVYECMYAYVCVFCVCMYIIVCVCVVWLYVCIIACVNMPVYEFRMCYSSLPGPTGCEFWVLNLEKFQSGMFLFLGWTVDFCRYLHCCCRGHSERITLHKGIHSRSGPTAYTTGLGKNTALSEPPLLH